MIGMDIPSEDAIGMDVPSTEPMRKKRVRRRTGAARTGGRSARVVADVLAATVEALARVGYAATRIDDIAERAGVNKTSIYRRWPTKSDLVRDALSNVSDSAFYPPNTESLREDLAYVLNALVARASSPEGRVIVRVVVSERANPEVAQIARSIREERIAHLSIVVERAIERGELPEGTDAPMVLETLLAPLYHRILNQNDVSEAYIDALITLVLEGARAGGALLR
jgi:AcrR family transcriptional regulator